MDSSPGTAAPVAIVSTLSFEPIDCLAPSIRGWMLSAPGVAMNRAMSPDGTRPRMRLPISCPDTNRSCPMYARRELPAASAL